MSYLNHIDWDAVNDRGFLQEDEVWDAIAEAEGLEYSEIADGDILDWL